VHITTLRKDTDKGMVYGKR